MISINGIAEPTVAGGISVPVALAVPATVTYNDTNSTPPLARSWTFEVYSDALTTPPLFSAPAAASGTLPLAVDGGYSIVLTRSETDGTTTIYRVFVGVKGQDGNILVPGGTDAALFAPLGAEGKRLGNAGGASSPMGNVLVDGVLRSLRDTYAGVPASLTVPLILAGKKVITITAGGAVKILRSPTGNIPGAQIRVRLPPNQYTSIQVSPGFGASSDERAVLDPLTGFVTDNGTTLDTTLARDLYLDETEDGPTGTLRTLPVVSAAVPVITSNVAMGSSLTVNFDRPTLFVGLTGVTVVVTTGAAMTVSAVASGNGTAQVVLTMSRAFVGTDVLSLNIASGSDVRAVASGVQAAAQSSAISPFFALFGAGTLLDLHEVDAPGALVTSAGLVTTFTDIMAGRVMSSATPMSVTTSSAHANGNTILVANGSTDLWSTTNVDLSGTDKASFAVCMAKTAFSGSNFYLSFGDAQGEAGGFFMSAYAGGGTITIEAYANRTLNVYTNFASSTSTVVNATGTGLGGGNMHVFIVTVDMALTANQVKIYFNGTLLAQGPAGPLTTAGNFGSKKLRICNIAGAMPGHAEFCAWGVMSGIMSATQMAAFQSRWHHFGTP